MFSPPLVLYLFHSIVESPTPVQEPERDIKTVIKGCSFLAWCQNSFSYFFFFSEGILMGLFLTGAPKSRSGDFTFRNHFMVSDFFLLSSWMLRRSVQKPCRQIFSSLTFSICISTVYRLFFGVVG